MCGRFTVILLPELLDMIYGVHTGLNAVEPRYNIAPTQPVMIVRQQLDGRRELAHVNWGLIPSWSRDPAMGAGLINARCETVAEKPSFRSAFRHRRCIIPASGFYEWRKTAGKGKEPWYFTSSDGNPLSFAGLWEHWQSSDGSEIESCAILTTSANALMKPVHDRMPVILPPEGFGPWLSYATRPGELRRFFAPCPPEALIAHPVSTLVNNPRNDFPELIRVQSA